MDIVKIRKKAKEMQKKMEEQPSSIQGKVEEQPKTQEIVPEKIPQSDFRVGDGTETAVNKEEVVMSGDEITTSSPEEMVPEESLMEEKLIIEVPKLEILEFVLGDEEYGVSLSDVREIIRMKPITEVPRTPAFVKGIISLRGTMIPVIDLKMRLKLGATEITQMTRIIITSDETKYIGIIVDRINGVVKIREDMIEPTPPTISSEVAEFIKGLGKYNDNIVRLLDLQKVSQFGIMV